MKSLVATICLLLCCLSTAQVAKNATFRFVNQGFFGELEHLNEIEYGATYRFTNDLASPNGPFLMCYYNTTPGEFTLAIRMGSSSHRRTTLFWVWEANRGNPVGENAVFALRSDGNLVLTQANGNIAWQTNTANKGVVGWKFLANGNFVLHDKSGKFVWQSFDSPTDTLLLGQTLHLRGGGANKLVSRLSVTDNKNGPFSLVVEPKGSMSLYFTSKNNPQKPLLYYASADFSDMDNNVTFAFNFDAAAGAFFFTLGPYITARAYHNSSLSFLRLGIDGNLKIITYNPDIERRAFITAYNFFWRDIPRNEDECQLPSRCGGFGLCEESQCVACPSNNGQLLGWSKTCQPPKLAGTCKVGGNTAKYYKLDGVDHFLSKYAVGEAIKETDCAKKCSSDCKCVGYFYHRDVSTCWVASDLTTLTRFPNSTHVGFIKTTL